jgi:lipopolysaccharide/colanic/teichoic acid biosynthesis glycosyltransferase
MSLVGPRPALLFQQDYYEAWELPRLAVPPGMTGLSQVSGGNALNWDQRILIDVYYVRHRHFGMYVWILLQTVLQIFVKKGIYTADGTVKGWTRPVPDWYQEGGKAPAAQEVSTDA